MPRITFAEGTALAVDLLVRDVDLPRVVEVEDAVVREPEHCSNERAAAMMRAYSECVVRGEIPDALVYLKEAAACAGPEALDGRPVGRTESYERWLAAITAPASA